MIQHQDDRGHSQDHKNDGSDDSPAHRRGLGGSRFRSVKYTFLRTLEGLMLRFADRKEAHSEGYRPTSWGPAPDGDPELTASMTPST